MDINNQNKKVKTLHIHTDNKFVYETKMYDGEYFDNKIIIFGKEESYKGLFSNSAKFFEKEQVYEVIELCKKADFVILYDLDFLKSQISLALPKDVKIAWRFFGYELYKKMKDRILSQKSKALLPRKKPTTIKSIFKSTLNSFYNKFKHDGLPEELFQKAIDRIDYMLVLTKHEYTYLSKYWRNLPEFIELSKFDHTFKDEYFETTINKKNNKIIVGNNRNIYNNHIDVLDMIEKVNNKEQYKFELLFNYGSESKYTQAVRNAVRNKPYFRLIDDFMTKEEFDSFYFDVSTLVINGYRQMAMANIFQALKYGVKVYLNKENIMMGYFLDNGIKVYSIDSLSDDIETENICLDKKTMQDNSRCLNNLYESYSLADFQEKIYRKFKS